MSNIHRRLLVILVFALVGLVAAPAGLAQEEAPAEETEVVVEAPEPAVEVLPAEPAADEPAWTFRYLIPTSLVIALLVVVGSIVAYFLRVVRTRYRLIQ